MHYYKYFGSNMDLQNSSQLESDDLHDLNNSDVTSDRKKGRTVCRKESTHFSGVGEEVSLMSETASSRACCLKHEGDCYSLETFFTSEDYKDLTGAQILETVIPVIEKYDASYLWDIFKSIVEKRMASPSSENLSETEWLKESTIRLAKILFYLPMKKMPSVVLEHLHSGIPVEKSQECIFSDSLKGVTGQPDVLSIEAKENSDIQDTSNYGPNVVKLLSKVDELHNQTVCLRDENTQIQEMLVEAGTKLKITSEENLQLKHQLLRAKVNLKEIDDLTSEIWSLKAKLTSYEHKERKKRKKLAEIENQRNVLFKRVQDVERKVQEWHAIVEDAKSEINALKNLVFTQERKIISVVQETTMTEIQLNELTQVKSELEKSVKELLEANDALRYDKRTLENHLAEMKLRLAKNDGITCIESVGCTDILYEDDSLVPQHEIISCSDNIHPSSVSTEGEVSADHQKSIEVKSGSQILQKSLAGSEDNAKVFLDEDVVIRKKNSSSGKLIISHSPDVRDQINAEIRALREQLVRSQVLFTYLLKDSGVDHAHKTLDCKTHLRTLLEEGNLSDVIFQCKSFDGQVPARFYNRSNRSSSSYASHRSTPMHCGYTSQSCPTLPIESPVVTKSTQTEPMSGVAFYMRTGGNGIFSATSSNSLSKGNVFFSPPSTPCETICEPLVLTDVCEVHHEPDSHSFPRHRTNSFLSAVKDGNPKLIDATSECRDKITELEGSFDITKINQASVFIDDGKIEFYDSSSSSKVSDPNIKHIIEENKSESTATEKKPLADKQSSLPTSSSVRNENDDKGENNKEKFKTSQRSMRRGSGAGSPNSQLSIPRYPAFDFGEQEDAQSLFPSPSEPEANRNIKGEVLQGMKISEPSSDRETSQSGSKSSKESSQKKRDSNKSKTLMPELMENSETESAKGSFECEAPDLPPSVDAPPPVTDIAFPSLPNTFLAKLGVHKDSPLSVEAFDEQELESKFIALSLAFKTDRTTLAKRLELHKRQRDMAEKNVESEFQAMRDHLNALNLKASRTDVRELISKIQNHLDIAQQATARVSGRSETYGAVQQEERVSRAFEVLVLHVDHLKRLFDKEHKELEETRRILTDTQAFKKEGIEHVTEDQKKYLRSFGLPVGSIKSVFSLSTLLSIFQFSFKVTRRRASVADFHQHSTLETNRSPGFNQSWTAGYGARRVDARQRTLCPFPTASSVGLSSSSLPTSQVNLISPSRVSTAKISARRCSLPAASPLNPNSLQNLEATSNNSNISLKPLSSPDKYKKKERNPWTRKLSAVSDEKEDEDQEEDESEKNATEDRISHHSSSARHSLLTNKHHMHSDALCVEFDADDESCGPSDSEEEDNLSHVAFLQVLRTSSLKDIFTQVLHYVSELTSGHHVEDVHFIKIWAFYPCIITIFLLLCTLLYIFIYK